MKRVVVLVLLLVAACGSSGGGGGDDARASAKKAYLAQAEAVCERGNATLAALRKQQPTSVAALPPFVQKIVQVARTNVTDLAALTPPPQDKADLEAKVLTPLREQLMAGEAYEKQVSAAAARNDGATLLNLVTNPPLQTKADVPWMKAYGFVQCAKAADTAAAAPR